MGEIFELGKVTCPSGALVVLDGGCLGLWSGTRSPSEMDVFHQLPPGATGSADFEVVGPDAHAAGLAFERRPGPCHYDIPAGAIDEWLGFFDAHCRDNGFDATLHRQPSLVPHRERAVRCARQSLEGFIFFGMFGVSVGGVPVDRPLTVTAELSDGEWDGWKQMTLAVTQAPVASSRPLGMIGVDTARLTFADLDALSHWRHDDPIDGRADVVFWGGPNASEAAAHFGVSHVDTPGEESVWGWTDLPVQDAWQRATAIQAWKDGAPGRKLALDFRPHSHHWQVMGQVRASETESGVVHVGGADLLFAMTSWGDGFFPAFADYDCDGGLVSVRVALTDEALP